MRMIELMVGGVIAVVMICAVVIPILQEDGAIRYWQYDDYRTADPGDTVDGNVFEIVTVGGTDYIHAKAVGKGTINGETVTVSKAKLDLVFMCGQSNASYLGYDPAKADPVPELGTAYYFGTEDTYAGFREDMSQCTWWTMLDENGDLRIGDKAPSYCATFTEKTGHKTYWVCGAVGGRGITYFMPPDGVVWTYMCDMLTAALALVDTSLFDLETNYYLWIQGESNTSTDIDTYKNKFLSMHDALLDGDCAGVKFKGCIIALPRQSDAVNSSQAQRELASQYSTIRIATDAADGFTIDNGLMSKDDLHYSQLGDNIIGKDLGAYVANLVIGSTPQGTATMILYIVPVMMAIGVMLAFVQWRREP